MWAGWRSRDRKAAPSMSRTLPRRITGSSPRLAAAATIVKLMRRKSAASGIVMAVREASADLRR
jgi:hypothetical protein